MKKLIIDINLSIVFFVIFGIGILLYVGTYLHNNKIAIKRFFTTKYNKFILNITISIIYK